MSTRSAADVLAALARLDLPARPVLPPTLDWTRNKPEAPYEGGPWEMVAQRDVWADAEGGAPVGQWALAFVEVGTPVNDMDFGEHVIDWPFAAEAVARPGDFEALGFRVLL